VTEEEEVKEMETKYLRRRGKMKPRKKERKVKGGAGGGGRRAEGYLCFIVNLNQLVSASLLKPTFN
jgi:hypothetical protein